MKKLFVYMLVGAGFFVSAAYADGYNPFHPLGGINSATTVPHVYSDGSTGTLAQIGQMADGSVQRTDANQQNGYAKLDGSGHVTVPVTGSVAAASANAAGDTVSSIADVAKSASTVANAAIPISQKNSANGVAPLDANSMMPSPVSGDSSASPVVTVNLTTPRTLASRFADYKNLRDYGAALNNSGADKNLIQTIYAGLRDGSVMHVPAGSTWDGTINNPDPTKNVTWIFDGTYDFTGWTHTPGDGDATISHKYGLEISRLDQNVKNWRWSPFIAFYWNADPNYCGAYCRQWGQQSAASLSAMSGPTSQGNTSPVTVSLNSFGMNPSSSYDVGLPVTVFKFGQNSTWGLDVTTNDYSGKSPSAFATWNEFDMWTNGQDIKTWDKGYGNPKAGNRSVFYVTVAHQNGKLITWSPNTGLSAHASGATDTENVALLNVKSPTGTDYVWYPVKNGTTGTKQPTFPEPARINGTISGGNLTVTNVVNGTISVGDTVTGANPTYPATITGQTSGTTGGVGVYTIDSTTAKSNTDEALYVAPLVKDGTISWQFGEETNSTVSSVLWLTAGAGDAVDTVIGLDKNVTVNNSVLNTELATMGSKAAAIRMADRQLIDFTGNGTASGQNLHTLSHNAGGLSYNVSGYMVRRTNDDGSETILPSTPTAAGTTIDDATVVGGPLSVVFVNADNAGVKVGTDMGGQGKQETIANNSQHPLDVYPINGAWGFLGKGKGVPIVLPPYASVKLTSISNYDCTIFAEYHPAAP